MSSAFVKILFRVVKISVSSSAQYYPTVAHLAWKKEVCRRRAAFDITFQHKTTFSLRLEINR